MAAHRQSDVTSGMFQTQQHICVADTDRVLLVSNIILVVTLAKQLGLGMHCLSVSVCVCVCGP